MAVLVSSQGCKSTHNADGPPTAPREFRAVWVATVGNIDWPSKPGLSSPQQQAEAIAILDRCKAMNINAIVLQVRPACDALYESKLEPWSYYLTGAQGKAPEPFYDPLKFWIDQSHQRAMELHAWFNPYRARAKDAKYESAATHVSRTNPNIVKEFHGWQWLDPAEQAAQKQTYDVFLDVATRYDVDGIHIDDYFYPYPSYVSGNEKEKGDFPDHASWQRYQSAGGDFSRADWRRDNVNQLIKRIYDGLKKEAKPVKFGISPFGLGKPSLRPAGIVGFSQYDELYADADLWFNQGWLDYFTPQQYWAIDKKGQEFEKLTDYWIGQNKSKRHYWPGLYTSRFAGRPKPSTTPSTQPAGNPNEITDQIAILRNQGEAANGHVHFSMKALMQNDTLFEQIKKQNETPALVPASPWLDRTPPRAPKAKFAGGMLSIEKSFGEAPRLWTIWTRYGGEWSLQIESASTSSVEIPADRNGAKLDAVSVSSVDRSGNESERVSVKL
jgi:uncharacterized lipoprotein YddW (UPF0748 family)